MGGAPLTEAPAVPAAATPSGNFGRLAFGFLAASVLSGVCLVPFWSASAPLESLERLQGGLPWGFFLRALHAYSSFGVLVSLVAHLVQVATAGTERQLPPAVWWRSVLLVPLSVAALLGGFVLRGDAEASAAAAVWRRIAESFPLLGPETARFLLGSSPGDPAAVAMHHAGTFAILLWLLTAEHGARLFPDARSAVLAGLASVALAGVVPLSLGSPPAPTLPGAAPHLLLGPWYLLGLQGALVDLPPFVGWLGPLLLVLLVGLLRHVEGTRRRVLLALAGAWVAVYLGFTVRLLLLARR